jgi:pimeloyl-ACP methyl ester carboxylesterase
MGRTIVFIHGAWMTAQSWETFRRPFEDAGYMVLTPTWPGMEGRSAEELRDDPPEGFGALSVGEIVDHLEDYVEALSEKPVILGHSFGGLFTQMLLDRGMGRAGVVLTPVPIAGLLPGLTTLRFALPGLLRGWSRPYLMDFDLFCERFANGAPPEQQDEAYERFCVPVPSRILYQVGLGLGTGIRPDRRRQPLLVVGGGRDRAVSPGRAHAAYARQSHSRAPTDYLWFPEASHFLIAEPGFEAIAEAAIDWLARL